MTVETIETVLALIAECKHTSIYICCVFEYEHTITGKRLYAVYQPCVTHNIDDSPYVKNPLQIYSKGTWFGDYEYLNG